MNFASQPAVFWWKPACWARVTGADAKSFLQGQFTNDLRPLEVEGAGAVYGLWLNVKGKVLADSFVLRGQTADEFWVCSYFSPAGVIRERLESHVIADDVVIEDLTEQFSAVTLLSAETQQRQETSADANTGYTFVGRRGHSPQREWIFPAGCRDRIHSLFADLPAKTAPEMEALRIGAAIPAVPADVGPADLPNEGGLDVDAISYTKGCYLGQEIMARLKSMGQVRRRLLRVTGPRGAAPVVPAPLFAGAKHVGELRSAVATDEGLRGLAMLNLLHVSPDQGLALAAGADPSFRLVNRP